MAQRKAPSVSTAEARGEGEATGARDVYQYSARSLRLKTSEEELFELVELSEVPLDKELFKVILELLKLNVAPATILQVLKTLRAQATQSSLPPSLHSSRASSRSQSPAPPRHSPQPPPPTSTHSDQLQVPGSDKQRDVTSRHGVTGQQASGLTQTSKERERPSVPVGASRAERSTLKSSGTAPPSKTSSKLAKGAKHRISQSKTAKS